MTQKAVIYCRVSDPKQVTKGHGLESQETRCREYARSREYEVVEVFHERGFTGGLIDRPVMQEMLSFLRKSCKKTEYVVIIDDISRLARDLEAHLTLRSLIRDVGGKLESPSIEFGEDSDSKLIERLLASVAAHQREKNAEQVKNRMRARMMDGFWVLQAPRGYRFGRTERYKKVVVPDDTLAPLVKEAMEGFACGRFESQAEVKYFLESKPAFPRGSNGEIHNQRITEMLTQILYTGYLRYEPWGIPLIPARHEALISMECFNKIQERLAGRAKVPARKDIREDFPLRGFVICDSCGHPLTSCWSKGRDRKYAYYLCYQKECADYKKSVRREKVEEEFSEILQNLQPSPDMFYLSKAIFKDCWKETLTEKDDYMRGLKKELRNVERKVEQLLERILATESETIIKSYEAHVKKLEQKKVELRERITGSNQLDDDFEKSFRTVFEFLSNPHAIWSSGDLSEKRMVQKLVFSKQLPYRRNEGFRTADFSLPFRVTEAINTGKEAMVIPVGFEPTTY